jgi:hypothetical protein
VDSRFVVMSPATTRRVKNKMSFMDLLSELSSA